MSAASVDFELLFASYPGCCAALSPELTVLAATDAFLDLVQQPRAAVVGQPLTAVYPAENPATAGQLQLALDQVRLHRSRHAVELPPDAARPGQIWRVTHWPVSDANGRLRYLMHHAQDVTSEHAAEQQTRSDFGLLATATHDSIWDTDLRTGLTWRNEHFHKVFGYNPGPETQTAGFWEAHVHPDDLPGVQAQYEAALAGTDAVITTEFRFRRACGAWAEVVDRACIVRDEQGRAIRVLGAMQDVTAEREARRARQENARRFRALAELQSQFVWTSLPDGRQDYANPYWLSYTGLTEEQSYGYGWMQALHPYDATRLRARYARPEELEEVFDLELLVREAATGQYRCFLTRSAPLRDGNGRIVQRIGMATDIQQYIDVQEQLRATTERFRVLSEVIPQLVWTSDAAGQVQYFNQRWLDYTGYTLEDSLGPAMWNALVHPDDRQAARARWTHCLFSGDYYEAECRLRSRDGSYRWFLNQALPLRDDHGRILQWCGSCTDIDEKKQAQVRLQSQNDELTRTNQDLDNFVYTASHDLKQPINNMAGIFEELMRTASFTDPEAPAMVNMFGQALQQIYTTIHTLSELVQVQREPTEELPETVDLALLTAEIVASLREQVRHGEARIEYDFSAAPVVPFRRTNLQSVLYNLLSNALKYASPDRPALIRLTSAPESGGVVLTLTDNGLGIDLDRYGSQLFQLFRRFHSHTEGTGMGLYLVNRLVQSHGGHVEVSSRPGEGTTFRIYFKG
ncbi:PAS domain-containing sensor histidine kinase [Hymenobacter sp. BT175]|uniref:PAS domain-containing sensor histidine kinase n=1 Tax=Hymenobacter translucens TaxID=2886507 RepID=UPI001D0E39C7|nr:PAS domain-containing sensor histidine kinase [Hymenobacter translucens]MCC2546481.1 PAS domain-containing sensor histidine kinase [Hymenobacter translucens]